MLTAITVASKINPTATELTENNRWQPNSGLAYWILANAHYKQGTYDLALRTALEGIVLDTRPYGTYLNSCLHSRHCLRSSSNSLNMLKICTVRCKTAISNGPKPSARQTQKNAHSKIY